MNGVCNESPQEMGTNIFVKKKATSLEWVLKSVFSLLYTVYADTPAPPPPMKSDPFMPFIPLQRDGKQEDCWTQKKITQGI